MTEPDSILSLPKRRHRHKSTHLQKAKLGTLNIWETYNTYFKNSKNLY